MDYEKAYKEALKRAKKIYDNAKELRCVVEAVNLETIFPELNESEDEKAKRIILALPFKHEADYKFVKIWLEKQGEPKQEWSEEDENRFQNIIACIEDCYNEKDAQDLIRWFKSLKHQSKPVWSKADIKMLELIIDGYQNTEDFSKVDGVFVDWLKSLKDRMKGKEERHGKSCN